jgi:hypothetical protein
MLPVTLQGQMARWKCLVADLEEQLDGLLQMETELDHLSCQPIISKGLV